jgi:hypothetical protein
MTFKLLVEGFLTLHHNATPFLEMNLDLKRVYEAPFLEPHAFMEQQG